jgi:hypothetical protein
LDVEVGFDGLEIRHGSRDDSCSVSYAFVTELKLSLHSRILIWNWTIPKQKLTAGNQPARSHLASVPAGTHGHIFVQCQDFCFLLFPFVDPPY